MKNIRTEIHITVATYIGDDVSQDKPALSRTADAVEAVSLTRVSSATVPPFRKTEDMVKEHVEALLKSASNVLPDKIAHAVRKL